MCRADHIVVHDTKNYHIDDFFDGKYLADHDLVNGRKCYRKDDQNDTLIGIIILIYFFGHFF